MLLSSLTVYLIRPAWCCLEHGHTAREVSPGEPSTELALSVPAPKVSKPAPNFPRHRELQGLLLAVGRAARGMVVPQRGASQQNLGSAASILLPIQWAALASRSWEHERLGASPAHWGAKGSSTPLLPIKMVRSLAVLTGHIFYRRRSPWSGKERTQQPRVINSDIPLPSSQGLLRAKGLWLQRFTPPRQGLTSSGSHYCLRTTCQSVRTCRNGFEVDCSAHGEGDAVFIE